MNKYIILCEGENENILICDIEDHYAKYLFASKGTRAVYRTQIFKNIKTFTRFWKVLLKDELILDSVIFHRIS